MSSFGLVIGKKGVFIICMVYESVSCVFVGVYCCKMNGVVFILKGLWIWYDFGFLFWGVLEEFINVFDIKGNVWF